MVQRSEMRVEDAAKELKTREVGEKKERER
jgi:hypothetical protein